jgi:hypothetical protein
VAGEHRVFLAPEKMEKMVQKIFLVNFYMNSELRKRV